MDRCDIKVKWVLNFLWEKSEKSYLVIEELSLTFFYKNKNWLLWYKCKMNLNFLWEKS
jgi:hypothetical protein